MSRMPPKKLQPSNLLPRESGAAVVGVALVEVGAIVDELEADVGPGVTVSEVEFGLAVTVVVFTVAVVVVVAVVEGVVAVEVVSLDGVDDVVSVLQTKSFVVKRENLKLCFCLKLNALYQIKCTCSELPKWRPK